MCLTILTIWNKDCCLFHTFLKLLKERIVNEVIFIGYSVVSWIFSLRTKKLPAKLFSKPNEYTHGFERQFWRTQVQSLAYGFGY